MFTVCYVVNTEWINDLSAIHVVSYSTSLFQVAERQGRYLAKQLANIHSGEQYHPFVYKPWGMLAYIGGYKALTDTPVAKSQGMYSVSCCYAHHCP